MPIDVDCACQKDGSCTTACPDLPRDPDCPKGCFANDICLNDGCPVPDPDCRAEGSACTTDDQCTTQHCVTDPQHATPYCSRACDESSDCSAQMECHAGACRYRQRPTATIGESCNDETYCLLGSICAGPTQAARACAYECGFGACELSDAACLSSYDGRRYCNPKEPEPAQTTTSKPPPPPPPAEEPPPQTDAGGCSATGRPAAAAPWLWEAMMFAIALRVRRGVTR